MDTDNLSNEAYQGVIIEAEKFNHDLTLRFGILASDCKNEEEYLSKATGLINKLRKMGRKELKVIFFGSLPDLESLYLTLDQISHNIEQIKGIPKEQRHYDF